MTVTTATIEPTTSVPTRTSRDLHLSPFVPLSAAHACAHCHEVGTTATGALGRTSLCAECPDLYYLHSGCLAPYKVAHGLRSVEGRIPRGPGDRAVAGAVAA